MSIEKVYLNNRTPGECHTAFIPLISECYVYKQLATCAIIVDSVNIFTFSNTPR